MNKNFKKVIAAVMAAATLSVGTVGMSVNAATGTQELQFYSSRYIGGGAPGSASYTDICELYVTNKGYYGGCCELDLTGTYGKVTIMCDNYASNTLVISQPKKGGNIVIERFTANPVNAKFSCACLGNHTVYSKGYVKEGKTALPDSQCMWCK